MYCYRLKRDDGVDARGGPSQAALVNALQSIDKAASDRISKCVYFVYPAIFGCLNFWGLNCAVANHAQY